MPTANHPHPCRFRLARVYDRGWGEIAFQYIWASDNHQRDGERANPPRLPEPFSTSERSKTTNGEDKSGEKPEEDKGGAEGDLPELAHCWLYEITTYGENAGTYADGVYLPPDPPFPGWQFRDPTDGRTGPVGLERFPASQGWAWDRHKLGGRLVLPPGHGAFAIVAMQRYCFHCEICDEEGIVPGPNAGPHPICRTFTAHPDFPDSENPTWRYALTKHDRTAWMDVNANGYVADSAGIGFGPP